MGASDIFSSRFQTNIAYLLIGYFFVFHAFAFSNGFGNPIAYKTISKLLPPLSLEQEQSELYIVEIDSSVNDELKGILKDTNGIEIASADGTKYKCFSNWTSIEDSLHGNFSDSSNKIDNGISDVNDDRITQLLRLNGTCFIVRVDFWTYRICPFHNVTQFHSFTKNKNVIDKQEDHHFDLGRFSGFEPSKEMETDSVGNSKASQQRNLVQLFNNGTNGRLTRVVFLCRDADDIRVSSISEPNVKEYEVKIELIYACHIDHERQALLAIAELRGLCIWMTELIWTYELCIKGSIRQFRIENGASTMDFNLGKHNASRTFQLQKQNQLIIKDNATGRMFLQQQYTDGTECDVRAGIKRETTVQYSCGGISHLPENDNVVRNAIMFKVDESQTCNYIIKVHTPLLCDNPVFESGRDPTIGSAMRTKCIAVSAIEDAAYEKSNIYSTV